MPGRAPGTVVIPDNLATHKKRRCDKGDARRRMLVPVPLFGENAPLGPSLIPPNPYSPDLNPSEMAYFTLKAHLRRIGARSFTDMVSALAEICDLYTPDECRNYFTAAGYVSS